MRFRFSNRASALITTTLGATDLTVHLETGAGGKLPVMTAGELFRATLISVGGAVEIVNCTLVIADTVTIERGQEGTAAQTFASGSRFEVRLTAGMAENFLQRTGDSMNGDLDMAGHKILRADFSGSTMVFGTFHASLWRSQATPIDQVYTAAENAVYIPNNVNVNFDARRPGYMGRVITNAQMFETFCFDAYLDVNHLPTHLKLCDGTNGTPDLRGRFIKGWTDTFGVGGHGSRGGFMEADPGPMPNPADETIVTTAAGDHNHSGATQQSGLGAANLPPLNVDITRISVQPLVGGALNAMGNINSITYVGGANHAHGINPSGSHQHFSWGLPPFFVLAKVMFAV